MKRYKPYKFEEAKQVGLLYHVMRNTSFIYMLKNNMLGKERDTSDFVSFSRRKDYNYVSGMFEPYSYKIIIDGDKLSHNYKIFPVADKGQYVGGHRFEAEERVQGNIKNISRYIKSIIIIKGSFNYLTEKVRPLLERYIRDNPYIVLLVQSGNKIYKDDKYLEEIGLLGGESPLQIAEELNGWYDKNFKKLFGFTTEREFQESYLKFFKLTDYENYKEFEAENFFGLGAISPEDAAFEITQLEKTYIFIAVAQYSKTITIGCKKILKSLINKWYNKKQISYKLFMITEKDYNERYK